MTVFAHPGHWLVNLIYVAPVLVIVTALSIQALRDRRRDEAGDDGDTAEPAADDL